jgi:hypothetical protein
MWRARLADALALPPGAALLVTRRLRLALFGVPERAVEHDGRYEGALGALEEIRDSLARMASADAVPPVTLVAAADGSRRRARRAA